MATAHAPSRFPRQAIFYKDLGRRRRSEDCGRKTLSLPGDRGGFGKVSGGFALCVVSEQIARLAELPNIVGVKDATAKVDRVSEQRATCGTDFVQLSGEDATALGFNAHGGVGCISVSANVAPRLCADFQAAMARHDWDGALALQDRLYPLHDALFSDSSPGPVKYALTRVRPDMPGDVRLPITWPSESSRAAVDRALEIAGLV